MPRIYELPASTGVENRAILDDPGTISGFRQQPQPQPQPGSSNPRQMLAGQMDMELNNVTREFDVNVSALDQQMLEPDKYKAQYANLQRRANNQRIAIQAKHEAVAQQIKNMQKLVEDRMVSPEQMQATMLVMAGVPSTHVKAMFAQQQRQKSSTRLNELGSMGKKLVAFRAQFEDYRGPHLFRGRGREKLYYTDPTGRKRKASEAEREAYDATTTQIAALDREKQEIFSQLTPLEQFSMAGSRAVERFGMGRAPLAAQRFGGVRFAEPVPKKKQKPIRQRNKRTGEERISYDGGKTWQMITG